MVQENHGSGIRQDPKLRRRVSRHRLARHPKHRSELPQASVAGNAHYSGLEFRLRTLDSIQERRELELADAGLQPVPCKLSLKQLLECRLAAADGE
jgi:hypothetical protein